MYTYPGLEVFRNLREGLLATNVGVLVLFIHFNLSQSCPSLVHVVKYAILLYSYVSLIF